jgi:hypothetical protein
MLQDCQKKCKRNNRMRWISKGQRIRYQECMAKCENEFMTETTGGNEGSALDKEADSIMKTATVVLVLVILIVGYIVIFKR